LLFNNSKGIDILKPASINSPYIDWGKKQSRKNTVVLQVINPELFIINIVGLPGA
jgi:hypothetical protein